MNINAFENESAGEADAKLYREIVGGLIYAMTCTRPDLSFVVTKLSQHMSKPNAHHMTMAKHTLRYIKATAEQQLIFRKSENPLRLILAFATQIGPTPQTEKVSLDIVFN